MTKIEPALGDPANAAAQSAGELTAPLKLSAPALKELVDKKLTCPFLGSAVSSTPDLPVRGTALDPLLSIADVRGMGNTGPGSNLGDLLAVFAAGNHAFHRGATGKLDNPIQNPDLFSGELPGSQGAHPGGSGILRSNPNLLGSGRLSQADWARLASRANNGLLKRSEVGKFIAENLIKDPNAKVFGNNVVSLLAKDLAHFVGSIGPAFMAKLKNDPTGHRNLEEKLTKLTGEDNLIGSSGEYGLLFAFLANSPGTQKIDGEPAISLADAYSMFVDKKLPAGWDSWKKTRLDWVTSTTGLMIAAGKEYLRLKHA